MRGAVRWPVPVYGRPPPVGRAQGGREEGDEVRGSFVNRENCRGSDVN